VENMAFLTAENNFEKVRVLIRELEDVDGPKSNLTTFYRVDLQLVYAFTVEVVIVDLVTREHEAVKPQVVNKHFFKFDALLSHVLIIYDLVGRLSVATNIELGLYE